MAAPACAGWGVGSLGGLGVGRRQGLLGGGGLGNPPGCLPPASACFTSAGPGWLSLEASCSSSCPETPPLHRDPSERTKPLVPTNLWVQVASALKALPAKPPLFLPVAARKAGGRQAGPLLAAYVAEPSPLHSTRGRQRVRTRHFPGHLPGEVSLHPLFVGLQSAFLLFSRFFSGKI